MKNALAIFFLFATLAGWSQTSISIVGSSSLTATLPTTFSSSGLGVAMVCNTSSSNVEWYKVNP